MSTRGILFLSAVATSALVALTACSNDSRSAPADTGSAPAKTSPPTSAPADTGSAPAKTSTPTPTASSNVGAPPDAEVLGTPRKGEPFTLRVETEGERATKLRLTVESVTCGKPLDPKILAEEAEGEPTPTPTPESGKQFCVVAMEATNVGKSVGVWSPASTVLNVRDTAYVPQDDYEYAFAYSSYWAARGSVPDDGLNPGSHGPTVEVFQIPRGTPPTTLWVPSEVDETGYLVRL